MLINYDLIKIFLKSYTDLRETHTLVVRPLKNHLFKTEQKIFPLYINGSICNYAERYGLYEVID